MLRKVRGFFSKAEVDFVIFNFPDLGPLGSWAQGPMGPGPRAQGPWAQGPGPKAQGPGSQIWTQISGFGPDLGPKWPPACRGSVRIFARVCLLFAIRREVPWRPKNGRKRRKIVKNRVFGPSGPPTGPLWALRGPYKLPIHGPKAAASTKR